MPIKIFCCSAREDETLLNKFKSHLMPLQREGVVDIVYDLDLDSGLEPDKEIPNQMNAAEVILLLISPDFMASDFCYHTEMVRALERHETESIPVIPIILRPVHWQGAPFAKLQILPKNGVPVAGTGHEQDVDQALYEVTEEMHTLIRHHTDNPLAYLYMAVKDILPPPGTEDVLRNPDKIYLPLTCSDLPHNGRGEDADKYIDRILLEKQAALIVGNYGTGKSFLAQKIFLEKAAAYRSRNEPASRIPILFPLKQLAGRGQDLVLKQIIEHLCLLHFFTGSSRQPTEEQRSKIEVRLRAGEFLCILDGFDEIPLISISAQTNPLEELNRLVKCLAIGDNRIIITTRPAILPGIFGPDFLKDLPELGVGFLQPWKGEETWHTYLLECIRLGIVFKGDYREFEKWALKELGQLTTTPLYCQMLVETRDDIMGTTDMNLAKLYSLYAERYFENVSARSPVSIKFKYDDLSKEIAYKKDCLTATAVGMLKKDNLRLTKEEIYQALQRDAQNHSDQFLKAFLELDIVIYSLLVLDPGNMYSFSHKSFYEYFAALKIYQELTGESRKRFATLRDVLLTNEIIAFLAGLLEFDFDFKEKLAEAFRKVRPLESFGIRSGQHKMLLRNLALTQLELDGRLKEVNLGDLNFNGYRFSSQQHFRELIGVGLDRCEMEGAVLTGVDLHGSRLRAARLNRSILDGADMREVDFTGAYLQDISCLGTRFSGAKFDSVSCKKQDVHRIQAAIDTERANYLDEFQDEDWVKDTEKNLSQSIV